MSKLTEREKQAEIILNRILARDPNSWSLADIRDLEEVIRLFLLDSKELQKQLSTALSRESAYRELIKNYIAGKCCLVDLEKALDRGPEEPVGRGEIVKALDEVGTLYQSLNLLEDFADAILTTFRVERR